MEKSWWELEVVVRRSSNSFANVPYSALFSETLDVVIWAIVLLVICMAAPFLIALLSRKQGCKVVMSVWQKCNSNNPKKEFLIL